MDYDACIKCARCTENCPATESGKLLSPMDLILSLRMIMDSNVFEEDLSPKYINPEIVWSCVTCGACVYQCPMLIHHVETILDLRRGLFNKGIDTPEDIVRLSYNVMRYGNPLAYNPAERDEFIRELVNELGVEIAEEGKEYDYIYWMGCNTSYDPADKTIAKALLKILINAGIKVAVLPMENCCGEPVRRIGDELLFKEVVNMNKELLSKYKFKKLIVNCPHGYNVFKHEYPLYGFKIDVVHHSQLLAELIKNGTIKLSKKVDLGRVTYHDPCYLGRWNGIFEEPRYIIKMCIDREKFVELRRSREKSFCCGGGGGQLYYDIRRGERIAKVRMNEIISSNVNTVVVACPMCKIMLRSEAPDDINVIDISELLVECI